MRLTRDLATTHSSLQHLRGDRDISAPQGRRRIEWLESKVANGQFFTPTWAIAAYRGEHWRVDGGHSSNMLANYNGVFPNDLYVLIRRFACDSMDDIADLFNQFDNSKSRRTLMDKAKAGASIHKNIMDIKGTWVNKSVAGIIFYLNSGNTIRVDEDDRVEFVHSDNDFIEWSHPLVKTKHLGTTGPVAAMYRGFLACPETAFRFWEMVRQESAPRPDHPTRKLASYLRECHVKDPKSINRKHFYSSRARYVKSIQAWNAWQRNESTVLRYVDHAPIPPMWIVDGSGNAKSI